MKNAVLYLLAIVVFSIFGLSLMSAARAVPKNLMPNIITPVDSCDQIITQSGDIINAKILEIGTKEIKYKKCDNIDGPTIVILRTDVLSVKYPNGTIDKIPVKKTHGLAIAAFVLGILAMIISFNYAGLIGILALIFGGTALKKINENPNKYKGKGFAKWGLALGITAVAVVLAVILITFAFG